MKNVCIELLDPFGLKSSSTTISCQLIVKKSAKTVLYYIIMLFLSTYILIFTFHT